MLIDDIGAGRHWGAGAGPRAAGSRGSTAALVADLPAGHPAALPQAAPLHERARAAAVRPLVPR